MGGGEMVDRMQARVDAIFSREHTLLAGKAISELPHRFSRKQLSLQMSLKDSQKDRSIVSREIEALVTAKMLKHVSHGMYERVDDPFWEVASVLYDEWSSGRRSRPVRSISALPA
jgi:hypothetical protein